MTRVDQGIDLAIDGVAAEGLAAAEAIADFARRHHVARVSIDNGLGPETRWEPEGVTVTLGGVAVPFPPGAFLQATPQGEAALSLRSRTRSGRRPRLPICSRDSAPSRSPWPRRPRSMPRRPDAMCCSR